MHELEMPAPHTRMKVYSYDAFTEEPIAVPVPAIIIPGRLLDGQVDESKFLIHTHLSPDSGVTRVGGRTLCPGISPEFRGHRNRVEDPEAFAGPRVVTPDKALFVSSAYGCRSCQVGGTDDNDTIGHDRCRVEAYLTRDEIHLLVDLELQIDNAVVTEVSYGNTRRSVERQHLITGRDVDDARLTAFAPVGQPASGQPPRCGSAALAFVLAMHP